MTMHYSYIPNVLKRLIFTGKFMNLFFPNVLIHFSTKVKTHKENEYYIVKYGPTILLGTVMNKKLEHA